MVKNLNEAKSFLENLMLEDGTAKKDILVATYTDLYRAFEVLEDNGIGLRTTLNLPSLPTIYSRLYGTSEGNVTQLESANKRNLLQGIDTFTAGNSIFYKMQVVYDTEEEPTTLYGFTKEAYNEIVKLANQFIISEKQDVPAKGIYRAETVDTRFGAFISYKEVTEIQSNTAIHPCKEGILNDIKFFFNNIPLFSKFNQKPLRKILLCGEPGTGKTSICYDIAKQYPEYPVVFVTDFQTLQMHIKACATENKRTVIIFEDCEVSMRAGRADSEIFNFLDGIDRPNIKEGGVIVMTTNHPEKLEERISKRPGRIDKIFSIDALTGIHASLVFKMYFEDFMKECDFDYSTKTAVEAIEIIASGMTGAQIKELFNSYICYMVSNGKSFNLYDIFDVKKSLFEGFANIKDDSTSLKINFKESEVLLAKALKTCA